MLKKQARPWIIDFGLFLGKKLVHLAVEIDGALADVIQGNCFCPNARMYGRNVPCRDGCQFCSIENDPRREDFKKALQDTLLRTGM